MPMKIPERLNASIDADVSKVIFDHLRNFLMCAFLLSIGTNEVKQHSSLLFGLLSSEYTGYGVIALATVLILLNLYDGVRKISNTRYHVLMTIVLVSLYVFFSIRVVEIAWNFRINY